MEENNTQTLYSKDVEVQQLDPQPILSVRSTIQVADLSQTMGDCIPALLSYLQQSGAQATGPLFVRYHTFGETETDIEIGVPVVGPATGEGRIAASELPGGPAIATWHLGPHDDKFREAYARIGAWPAEHDREAGGPPWEVYCWIDPTEKAEQAIQADPATWRTRLVQPIR